MDCDYSVTKYILHSLPTKLECDHNKRCPRGARRGSWGKPKWWRCWSQAISFIPYSNRQCHTNAAGIIISAGRWNQSLLAYLGWIANYACGIYYITCTQWYLTITCHLTIVQYLPKVTSAGMPSMEITAIQGLLIVTQAIRNNQNAREYIYWRSSGMMFT